MSLLVHLPLNGNLENKGLADITISGSPTFSSSGKIGNCLTNGDISITCLEISQSKIWSICFWGKVISDLITSNWTLIMKLNDGSSNLRVEVCPSNYGDGRYCYSVHNNTEYKIINGTIQNPVGGYYDKWIHFTLTSDGSTIKKFIDGTFIGSTQYTGDGAINGIFTLNNNNKINKNDFRIYNHCLSPKEVKEISKGLILHYPLDDIIQPNLIPNQGQYTESNPYVLTTTANDGNRWLQNSAFEVKPSTTYTYSVCCDGEIASAHAGALGTFSMWLYLCNNGTSKNWQNGEYDTPRVFLSNNNNHKLIGNRHIWTYTTTANEKYMSIRMNNYGTGGVTHNYWNFKVEEGNVCTLWLPNVNDSLYNESNFGTKTIYDCSGFGHDGTVTGALSLNSDTPRYKNCTYFNSGSKINGSGLLTVTHPEFTLSYWVKLPTATYTRWADIFSFNTSSPFRQEVSNTSGTVLNWYGTPTGTDGGLGNVEITNNTWNFLTLSSDGVKYYVYKNGLRILFKNISGNEWNRDGDFKIGDNGMLFYMSDLKMYATCLSDEDILELYNTSAFITDNGTTECYEFDETGSNPIVNKTGIVKVGNLYEDGVGEDTKMNLDTEQTKFGSDFITSKQFNEI